MKPHVLVTNDDGIDSAFLHQLVDALLPEFRVSVAAPAFEQSWIGRAMTRRGEIDVIHSPTVFAGSKDAWTISGTPTDCVNIALGHLLSEKPDMVVSGINIGYNTTETLMLSSGTLAGAIEGALWGLPAIAFSKCVPKKLFEEVSNSKGDTSGAFSESLYTAAKKAAEITLDTWRSPPPAGTIVNINFPPETTAETSIRETYPAQINPGSLFEETRPGRYRFAFNPGVVVDAGEYSDRGALEAGYISRSLLDFSRAGRKDDE